MDRPPRPDPGRLTTGARTSAQLAAAVPSGPARALAAPGVGVQRFVPSRLFPFDLEPVTGFVGPGALVSVDDDGPGPAGRASAVAAGLVTRLWGTLRKAHVLLSSAPSVVPAARELESRVVISSAEIARRLGRELRTP
ncbi:hypothetical protein ABZ667_29935 [Streptomyces lavendulae]|uniref:hypothetical protein n=1 Tax=Streptomyces lavendulae TaxID=1914 RepID=UPI00340306CD